MNARQRLADAFFDDGACTDERCYCGDNAGKTIERLITDFVHELAEKVRDHPWETPCPSGCCPGHTPWDVADFIEQGAA